MLEPRILIVSSVIVSRFFGVILTVRRAVFIVGDTDAMVPLTTVPFLSSIVTVSFWHFIKNLTSFMVAVRGCVGSSRRNWVWARNSRQRKDGGVAVRAGRRNG